MIDVLAQNIAQVHDSETKLNKTREFLQTLMLKVIFDKGGFENIAFVGGTALRILHGIRRFSEDMDFSLIRKKGYSFPDLIKGLSYELQKNNIETETKTAKEKTVNSCFIKYPGLTGKLGIKGYQGYTLQIKIEVDTNPPQGAQTTIVPLTDKYMMAVKTFDLPSLFATKLHACFFRKYTKGRDFYDLIWYLGKKIEPNITLLNNAIKQTEKTVLHLSEANYKSFLRERIREADFKSIRNDVAPFLEDKNELKMLDKELILNML